VRHDSAPVWSGARLSVVRDEVTTPGGQRGAYEWVAAPDLVRIAIVVDGSVLLISQYHYLAGSMLQLPGGGLKAGESSIEAARQEVAEETGFTGGTWSSYGALHPLPGLTNARVHLVAATDLTPGSASPEESEADLRVIWLPLGDAVCAIGDGRLRCAASAALVQMVAAAAAR
jgi:8-oxo-dGTP pyrophosphatase MutT (NUDIX family)